MIIIEKFPETTSLFLAAFLFGDNVGVASGGSLLYCRKSSEAVISLRQWSA